MAHYLAHDLIVDLSFFEAVLLLIALLNVWTLRRATRHKTAARLPKVSMLVPARNEEVTIERCIRSLLAQDYPDFEVLVLDDGSTDRTRAIVRALAGADPHLTALDGCPLPEGWLGKNWACAQLAARATGELLCFTDADTVCRPEALRVAVSAAGGRAGRPCERLSAPGGRDLGRETDRPVLLLGDVRLPAAPALPTT